MKRAFTLLLFPLFAIELDADDVDTVSMLEGDSVTLHTGVKEVQKDDVIDWRFNGILIARLNSESSKISVWVKHDGDFRDRLQMNDQTGDLKIRSIRTTDFGQYILKITSTVSSSTKFNISGVPVNKIQSVPVGESVTLLAGVTNTQKYDVIQWRRQKTLVAEINRKNKTISTYEGPDGRFRGRLLLDHQTGSLTITNTRTEDFGHYDVDITSSGKHTIQKTYTVIVTGENIIESVNEGDSLFLRTDVIEIQTDDQILWMFENILIAEINKEAKQLSTYDGPDGRFRDRLKLDHQTGSLTIIDTRTTDSGVYTLQIIGSTNKHKRITVTVSKKSTFITEVILGVLLVIALVALGVMCYRDCHRKRLFITWNNPSLFPVSTADNRHSL